MPPSLADIQSELAASTRGLVIVGTGVTLAATAGTPATPLASWDGLLHHGIDHCTRFGRRDAPWAAALHSRLRSPDAVADPATLLAVAAEVVAALTLVQYAGRLHRLHPKKVEVRIFDYVDREVPMLRGATRSSAGRRATVYKTRRSVVPSCLRCHPVALLCTSSIV
jgi:hypothetical protein